MIIVWDFKVEKNAYILISFKLHNAISEANQFVSSKAITGPFGPIPPYSGC